MLHLIVFSVFGLVCVAGAVNLLVQRHPINSALSLVVVMGSLAGEDLLLNAGEEDRTKGSRVAMLFGIPGVLIGSVLVAWVLLEHSGTGNAAVGALPGPPKVIGWLLFHDFLLPFEVTSVLVLIAIMGAVVLASHPGSVQQSAQPDKREG